MATFDEVRRALEQRIADPLLALRGQVATLNQYHNQCVQQCQDAINALMNGTDGQPAWQGPGGQAVAEMVTNYLSAARAVSGSDTDAAGACMDGYMLKPVQIGETIADELYTSLESIAGPRQIASVGVSIPASGGLPTPASTTIDPVDPVGEVVLGIDTGAVVQCGLDVPWDVVAGLATGGYLIYKAVTYNPDQAHIDLANEYAAEAEQMYEDQIDTYTNTEPLQRLPDSPKGPNGDFGTFLLVIGLAITAGGAMVFLNQNQLPVDLSKKISQLTPEELDKLKTYLADVYGCSPAQIEKILQQVKDQNPTAVQVENLLKLLKMKWQIQTLQQDVQNANYPNANKFLRDNVNGELDAINNALNNGAWADDPNNDWTSAKIAARQANIDSAQYQFQVAQALNARDIESKPPSIGADVTSGDNVSYEVKNSAVHQNDSNYVKLVEQLKKYLDEQSDTSRGIGVIVNTGSDRNLAAELLASLKSANPNDPKIKWLKNIDIKFMPYTPPDPPSNRWCRM